MFIFIIVFIYIYICIYKGIYIFKPFFHIHIYTLNFLDYIWYSLEHTGNARTYRGFARTYQDNTSNTPGSYERLYRDWPKGYTGILAQGLAIGYVKTSVDWPHMPSQIKQLTIFLEMGMRSRAWVGRDRKHSENFSKKLDDIVKA